MQNKIIVCTQISSKVSLDCSDEARILNAASPRKYPRRRQHKTARQYMPGVTGGYTGWTRYETLGVWLASFQNLLRSNPPALSSFFKNRRKWYITTRILIIQTVVHTCWKQWTKNSTKTLQENVPSFALLHCYSYLNQSYARTFQ